MCKKLSPVNGTLELIKAVGLDKLEAECLKKPQAECPVVHYFSPGICVREVSIPAGTFAIGHRQKKEHLNIFLKGAVTVYKDDGQIEELIAPMIFVGQPGRKVGHVTQDLVWLNVYPTNKTSISDVEEEFMDKSTVSKEVYKGAVKCLSYTLDSEDYVKVLQESGYTEEQAQAEVQNLNDQIPFPLGPLSVKVDDSPIHGKGLFAMSGFQAGEVICDMRIEGKRTPAGRYTNHSRTPNAVPRWCGKTIQLVALLGVKGCLGGFNGDEITIDYREAMKVRNEEVELCHQ